MFNVAKSLWLVPVTDLVGKMKPHTGHLEFWMSQLHGLGVLELKKEIILRPLFI